MKTRVELGKEETLQDRLEELAELKSEMKAKRKAFRDNTKHLRDMIESLENIVTAEVIELGHTVMAENIKVEYIPTVKIVMKKEQDNG